MQQAGLLVDQVDPVAVGRDLDGAERREGSSAPAVAPRRDRLVATEAGSAPECGGGITGIELGPAARRARGRPPRTEPAPSICPSGVLAIGVSSTTARRAGKRELLRIGGVCAEIDPAGQIRSPVHVVGDQAALGVEGERRRAVAISVRLPSRAVAAAFRRPSLRRCRAVTARWPGSCPDRRLVLVVGGERLRQRRADFRAPAVAPEPDVAIASRRRPGLRRR